MILLRTTSLSSSTNRPSIEHSSAPCRTMPLSARPPTSSSIASTRSVLPAPVSPVSAVIPGPRTSTSSSITPRLRTASSVSTGQTAASAVVQAELRLEDAVEVALAERDEARTPIGGRALDDVTLVELADAGAVDRQRRRTMADHFEAQRLARVEDQRPV